MKRSRMEGLGVTARELEPGAAVLVAVGRLNAVINGGPCTIAWAEVEGPADEKPRTDPAAMWWLNVYSAPGAPPLPQMYRADEILGIPSLALRLQR